MRQDSPDQSGRAHIVRCLARVEHGCNTPHMPGRGGAPGSNAGGAYSRVITHVTDKGSDVRVNRKQNQEALLGGYYRQHLSLSLLRQYLTHVVNRLYIKHWRRGNLFTKPISYLALLG